jgi:hypothetical protein
MPRNFIRQIALDAEPMLGAIASQPVQRTWLPAFALRSAAIDTTRWQTRAARGFSWHRTGTASHMNWVGGNTR